MRDYDDELQHRRALRQKYFEDPRYRRWSDVVPGGLDGRNYTMWRDDRIFDYLITNQVSTQSNLSKLNVHLRDGHELPINWENFYAYFDEQLTDPENRYVEELVSMRFYDQRGRYHTVETLLNQYRDKLYNSYDII